MKKHQYVEIAGAIIVPLTMLFIGHKIGYEEASQLPHAQVIVLADIAAHKKFVAEFNHSENPDFLQELSPEKGDKHASGLSH